jgi:hypothetical protein
VAQQRQPADQTSQDQYAGGEPMQLTPQPQLYPGRRVAPQERPDDGYIYPADGSPDEARYPAPRGMNRPLYDAQANQQRQYNNNQGYAPPPQGYYYQPQAQPQYYQQQRGYYQN